MDNIKALSLSMLKEKGLRDFCVIDIRSKLAFASAHLKDSVHLPTLKDILLFLPPPPRQLTSHRAKSLALKPILIVCFSATAAKNLALKLSKNTDFWHLYPHKDIFYLQCGIMEAFDNGFEAITADIVDSIHSSAPVDNLITTTIENIKHRFLTTKRVWVVAFSGGKDSTCLLQLVYEMLASLPKHQQRQTYAIASNTLVEAPHIDAFLHNVVDSINTHARENHIPFEILQVKPSFKDDFWVNLIGKGYPSPTRTFRWCTDRLKITPAKAEVAKITHRYGSALLILGTRKAESSHRKKSIQKRILNEDGYSQHHDFPDTLTFAPIAEWSTDEVWAYLTTHKPLCEKDHSELFSLYAKAGGDECQFITDLSQSSCGGSRFGCWVCTVVNEDKSLQGFIESGEKHLKPLNDFRNYIKRLREDANARADYKRDGRAVYKVGGLGPFLSHKRKEILQRLLETERVFMQNGGKQLISDEQILAIQKEWDRDFDFNKSAIILAKEVGRMKDIDLEQGKLLHKEILEHIVSENESKCNGIDTTQIENLISSCIDIYNNSSLKGRNSAGVQIKKEIDKLLDDKTSKQEG
ncbi:DNA phosphorothioation system sulfurtransferase DndC [uncultured Helicobacter sp.]|uniref:DNA phosphorothioation system sulfurtransferase DndC n=1 Tax=uncultured Helicobacter sp. TaxID=175537 RepID=UPI00261D937A|nr:DNA phosphorothioation system sulfurtransferase DndC [uncultured Helicobacter sp.]